MGRRLLATPLGAMNKIKDISKHYIFCLLISHLIITGCNNSEPIKSTLEGDWLATYKKGEYVEKNFVFSFEDSMCTYIHPTSTPRQYEIISDTIIISYYDRNNSLATHKFYIESIDDKTLTISPQNEKTRQLFKNYQHLQLDELNFIKIEKKNNYNFTKIAFFSSVCFGSCPSMYIELDSNGNILYQDLFPYDFKSEDSTKYYSGKISTKYLEIIKNKVTAIDLDKLKEDYSAMWTCDQTCEIIIKNEDSAFQTRVYGYYREPVELRILFEKLMDLSNVTKLEKKDNFKKLIEFKSFYNKTAQKQTNSLFTPISEYQND